MINLRKKVQDHFETLFVFIELYKSVKKLNFEKKVIETEEANSSLSLEEAIVRWVGLDEIKQKFNASDIMLVWTLNNFWLLFWISIFRSCTIVQQQAASSSSEKSSEINESQNVTGDVEASDTKEDEAVVIDQKEATEAKNETDQTEEAQSEETQNEEKQEPTEDLKQSAIESNEDKDDEIIQAIRVEDETSEEIKEEEETKNFPQSLIETNEDSAESVIQAVRVEDEPADDGQIEATQEEDTKSISSESSGLIYN